MELPNRAEAERLLREANVLRIRRQTEQAEEKCRAALALAPDDAIALEMLGDLLRERDRLQEAAEQFRLALEHQPGRAPVEKKFAEVTLELAERQRLRDLAQFALDQPATARARRKKRNASMAVFWALVWPGLGHFYVAEGFDLKGAILAGAAAVCFLGLDPLMQIFLALMGARGGSSPSGWAALGLLFVLIWIYSIADAVVQAQRPPGGSTDRLGF